LTFISFISDHLEVIMSSIAVVTDSDSSLPPGLAEAYGIQQVPINIHFGNETLRTGTDIDDAQLFERVDREGALPTTSAPTPGQFSQAYEAAFDGGYDSVFCLCVSSEISATYTAALHARDLFPDRTIVVVDSRSISMGQGYMAIEAAKAARAGLEMAEVVARAESVRERTYLYAALDTLKYLAMSGRVGHLTAGMASLLGIKPVLTLREGKLDMLEKVRTRKKAWHRVAELTQASLDGRAIEQLAILHVNAAEPALQFEALLRNGNGNLGEIVHVPFTAGLSVHTGPGMVGVVAVAAPA
jgi:DegV family protein with EDD domain